MSDLKQRQTDIDNVVISKSFAAFKFVRPLLGLVIVLATFGFLYILVWITVPQGNKEIILLAAGYVLGMVSTVSSYYFGTSKDKSDAEQSLRTPNTRTQVTTTLQESQPEDKK